MMYHGCEQSRKLLAHYRRCRTLRSRLATGNTSNSSNAPQSTTATLSHHCLVCSLVARQARTMLEQRTAPPPTTTTNGMNVFKSSSTNMKRNILSSSSTTRQKMASSYTVLSATTTEKHLMNGRNGYQKCDDSPAMKMPPPPPRTMNHTTAVINNDRSNDSNIFNDSLARLYATAKQLDTVTSLDHPTNSVESDEHHHRTSTNDAYPVVVRRERSVSDTELFHYNKTTLPSISVVEMNQDEDGVVTSHNNNNDTIMMMVDDNDDHDDEDKGEEDMDDIIHMASTDLSHPKQRIRSASCGSGTKTASKAVVSLSPSHYCETIVEEDM